jgi:hypothetical protein
MPKKRPYPAISQPGPQIDAGSTMGMAAPAPDMPMVMPYRHSMPPGGAAASQHLGHFTNAKVLADGHNTIGPIKKGALHAALGMASDVPISGAKLQAAKAKGGLMAKRAQFAINARKWKH